MVILVKITNQKNDVSFIPNAFSQSEYPFDQCKHFNQVEPFEKSQFLIMIRNNPTILTFFLIEKI
jgi:hypothetical protein